MVAQQKLLVPQKTLIEDMTLDVLRRSKTTWFTTMMLARRVNANQSTVVRALQVLEKNNLVLRRRALDNDMGAKGFEWRIA